MNARMTNEDDFETSLQEIEREEFSQILAKITSKSMLKIMKKTETETFQVCITG